MAEGARILVGSQVLLCYKMWGRLQLAAGFSPLMPHREMRVLRSPSYRRLVRSANEFHADLIGRAATLVQYGRAEARRRLKPAPLSNTVLPGRATHGDV